MDMEKFTERSRGFLQAAQTLAVRSGHQKVAHLVSTQNQNGRRLSTRRVDAKAHTLVAGQYPLHIVCRWLWWRVSSA